MAPIDFTKIYTPQPRQQLLHATQARQILYGGAAGGGKSMAMRWDAISFCLANPGLNAIIFRRTLPELRANHIRFLRTDIPPEVGQWKESEKLMSFFNGSQLVCGYAENEMDIEKYQGQELHYVGIEEAGQFTPYQISYLRGRNRIGNWVPSQPEFLPRLVMTANPGGVSHAWLKEHFIDPAPPETLFLDDTMIDPDDPDDKGWPTIFIPATMHDNAYIDKGYGGQFAGLPEELQRALREGDWDVAVGAFFSDTWRREKHVLKPFTIPGDWMRFMSYDHGSAHPFCVHWWAVAPEDYETPDGQIIPASSMVCYREWYGATKNNKGLKLTAEQIAAGIKEMQGSDRMTYGVADPSVWKFDGGPSIGERLARSGVAFRRADNSRIAGWDQVRRRLRINEADGRPRMFFFNTCTAVIRTLPVIPHDKRRIEDIDTRSEDHAADSVRYAAMSRPFTKTGEEKVDEVSKAWTVAGWAKETRRRAGKSTRINVRI